MSLAVPSLEKTSSQSSTASARASSPPRSYLTRIFSHIEVGSMRFVILDCPTDSTLPDYLKELQARGVTDVVRVCEPTYGTALLRQSNIAVHDWPFKDGGVPTPDIIKGFLTLADARFGGLSLDKKEPAAGPACIAVHCVAGLGRAPVLVALALIEAGMAPLDAIALVRKHRRGAFNSIQLQYLVDTYKRSFNKRSTSFSNFLSGMRSASASRDDVSAAAAAPATAASGSHSAGGSPSAGSGLRNSLSKVFGGLRRDTSAQKQQAVSS
ncbi:Protein tyrosine phosphatase type IVA 2 [Polyrhizophydium stewartii]|uniref:Protein tyrosine phosphatase type IVA 2 n=1 Tax=Polyrhizophydium stewartii TaxID=2732419 RepID=A0ABR4N8W4_9FUNG|nr:Protein tyrosine phosphatase type IVA 1 [Polyrhizophydium stewartii]